MNTPILHGCSTQKLHENSTNLFSLCNLNKEKYLFFFTLSDSHCVSPYFFTRTAPQIAEYLLVILLTLWNYTLCFTPLLSVFLSLSHNDRMAFLFFSFFSPPCVSRACSPLH